GATSAAAFYSMRHMPLAAIAMAPVMARAFAGWTPLPWQNRWLARLPARLREGGGKELGEGVHALNWALCIVAGLALLAASPSIRAWRDARTATIVPVDATRFIETHDLRGRIFNDYASGGYLIHRLYPGHRVFV